MGTPHWGWPKGCRGHAAPRRGDMWPWGHPWRPWGCGVRAHGRSSPTLSHMVTHGPPWSSQCPMVLKAPWPTKATAESLRGSCGPQWSQVATMPSQGPSWPQDHPQSPIVLRGPQLIPSPVSLGSRDHYSPMIPDDPKPSPAVLQNPPQFHDPAMVHHGSPGSHGQPQTPKSHSSPLVLSAFLMVPHDPKLHLRASEAPHSPLTPSWFSKASWSTIDVQESL